MTFVKGIDRNSIRSRSHRAAAVEERSAKRKANKSTMQHRKRVDENVGGIRLNWPATLTTDITWNVHLPSLPPQSKQLREIGISKLGVLVAALASPRRHGLKH